MKPLFPFIERDHEVEIFRVIEDLKITEKLCSRSVSFCQGGCELPALSGRFSYSEETPPIMQVGGMDCAFISTSLRGAPKERGST